MLKLCILFFLLSGCGQMQSVTNNVDADIQVSIQGEIQNPGVYTIANNTSVANLIEIAGGVLETANLSTINLNYTLVHKDVITIPKADEKELISINAASLEQLMEIKGIGIVMAKRIVAYREENGYFQKLEDLMLIKGIKEKMFQKILPYIQL